MGLDLTIAKTKDKLNLCELVAIYDVIRENMDWYLGNDESKRYSKYLELTSKVFSLTKKDIIDSISDENDKELKEHLIYIPNETFDVYLEMIRHTMEDFCQGNSHLNFDFDRLPFVSIHDTCSWTTRGIFEDCKSMDIEIPGQGDAIMELDKEKILELGKKWNGNSFKIWFARWIGYFMPEVEERICDDLCKEILPNEYGLDALDLWWYKNAIMEVCRCAKKSKDDERIWMISSY